jgi:hypothetical protein
MKRTFYIWEIARRRWWFWTEKSTLCTADPQRPKLLSKGWWLVRRIGRVVNDSNLVERW